MDTENTSRLIDDLTKELTGRVTELNREYVGDEAALLGPSYMEKLKNAVGEFLNGLLLEPHKTDLIRNWGGSMPNGYPPEIEESLKRFGADYDKDTSLYNDAVR